MVAEACVEFFFPAMLHINGTDLYPEPKNGWGWKELEMYVHSSRSCLHTLNNLASEARLTWHNKPRSGITNKVVRGIIVFAELERLLVRFRAADS